jgi:glycosyltransferase involved in cell wall biosynthesis
LKIHICGSRGIPNNYGGFEQCAERLAVLLAEAGHDITVYNPEYHPYQNEYYGKVKINRHWNPEHKIGSIGNFIYDYRCLKQAYAEEADAILVLGYTTASIFFPFIRNKRSVLITNMDGLEWKRDKWNIAVKQVAKALEWLGARYSDFLVADNREIQKYLNDEYKRAAMFIAYGADTFNNPDAKIAENYSCQPGNYDLLIARLEKENNIEMILDGVVKSGSTTDFLVVGNHGTSYGVFLKDKYTRYPHIRFTGSIYNLQHLNNLRYYSRFYFHGHSVGGTNPSLLEAMASSALIIAHDNPFNRDVLGVNAYYFSTPASISKILNDAGNVLTMRNQFISQNLLKIEKEYNWKVIAERYEKLCREAVRRN